MSSETTTTNFEHDSPDSVERRKFNPPLGYQRWHAAAAIVQKLCLATSIFDVGCSTSDFGKFALAASSSSSSSSSTNNNSENNILENSTNNNDNDTNFVSRYSGLDLRLPSIEKGAQLVEDEVRAQSSIGTSKFFPKLASFYCGNVFSLSNPSEKNCPFNEKELEENNNKNKNNNENKFVIKNAPHSECIVSIDVVEHFPKEIDLTDDDLVVALRTKKENSSSSSLKVNGPLSFLKWIFHIAPCKTCCRAVCVTTPNISDNVPILQMPQGELRHWDHKFEWTLEEFAENCRSALNINVSENNNNNNNNNSSSWKAGAWLQFGIGGTASQGVVALQQEMLSMSSIRNSDENENENNNNENNNDTTTTTTQKLWKSLTLLWKFDSLSLSSSSSSENSQQQKREKLFQAASELFEKLIPFSKLLHFEIVKQNKFQENEQENETTTTITRTSVKEEQEREKDDDVSILNVLSKEEKEKSFFDQNSFQLKVKTSSGTTTSSSTTATATTTKIFATYKTELVHQKIFVEVDLWNYIYEAVLAAANRVVYSKRKQIIEEEKEQKRKELGDDYYSDDENDENENDFHDNNEDYYCDEDEEYYYESASAAAASSSSASTQGKRTNNNNNKNQQRPIKVTLQEILQKDHVLDLELEKIPIGAMSLAKDEETLLLKILTSKNDNNNNNNNNSQQENDQEEENLGILDRIVLPKGNDLFALHLKRGIDSEFIMEENDEKEFDDEENENEQQQQQGEEVSSTKKRASSTSTTELIFKNQENSSSLWFLPTTTITTTKTKKEEEEKEGYGTNSFSVSLVDFLKQQQQQEKNDNNTEETETKTTKATTSIEEILWAAVNGYYDGAEIDEETGEKVLWL